MTLQSTRAVSAALAQETDEAFIMLLRILHDDLDESIRVTQADVAEAELDGAPGVYSRGAFYAAYPVKINLPGQSAEELARVTLTIDNVDRRIVQVLRSIATAPDVEMEVVLLDTPDIVEAGPYRLRLREARYDLLVVEGELTHEDILNEPYPGHSMTPGTFPGLF